MEKHKHFFQFVWFVKVSAIGGFVLSLIDLPIGWMIGTLLTAAFLSILRPNFLHLPHTQNGIPKYWLYIGQYILGIELGQKVNASVLFIFKENWSTIIIMLLLSIFFSLLSGLILWKFGKLDMLTSFFATAPGGLSSIPGIAEEVGANTGVVSIIQAMRVFLVIITIPVMISFLFGHSKLYAYPHAVAAAESSSTFGGAQLALTILFMFIAWIGYLIGKFLKFSSSMADWRDD